VIEPRAERRDETLALLMEVSRSFHALLDVEEVLALVTRNLRALLGAEACSVILYDAVRREFYFPAADDDRLGDGERLREVRFPADRGIAGWVLAHDTSALVADAESDPRFYAAVDREVGTRTRSVICAPLRTRAGVIGVTQAINKRTGPFTDADLALLDALAGSIAVAIENARLHERLRREKDAAQMENRRLRRELSSRFRDIVGTSPALVHVLEQVVQVAPTRAAVMILGESGTGKELVARAIHEASDRAQGPFVAINCGAIPGALLEAELFGHERGAFTGAVAARRGKFEMAQGGTLFLDEIGDLEPALQPKLLRALSQGELQRLGSEQLRTVDVRVVAATHRDLTAMVADGRFREDLYWRINVITLELPPLRARPEDVPLLVRHFLAKFARELKRGTLTLDPEAEAALLAYDYPGNIRELENLIQRAAILARGATITRNDLPARVTQSKAASSVPAVRTNDELKAAKARAADAAVAEVEIRFLTDLLRRTHGNVAEAAREVDMNRTWLHELMKRHRLDPRAFR
jgi:transcriptional regulator with GAF, ATPase, and Fis domain